MVSEKSGDPEGKASSQKIFINVLICVLLKEKKQNKTLKLQLLGTDLKDNINASLEHFSALIPSGYSSTRFDVTSKGGF